MLKVYDYDKLISRTEIVFSIDDDRDLRGKKLKLVPCCGASSSAIMIFDLVRNARDNGLAFNERQAKQLLSNPSNLPYAPRANILFPGTIRQSLDGLLWIPYLSSLYLPWRKKEQIVLWLMNVSREIPLFVQHYNHHFPQIC